MALIISFGFFLVLLLTISWVGYRYYARPAQFIEQVGVAQEIYVEHLDASQGVAVRILRKLGENVPISPEDASLTRRMLIAAGFRDETAVAVYYGMRILFFAVFVVAGFFAKDYLTQNGTLRMVALGMSAFGGFFLPGLLLEGLISARHERLRLSLPDALDLMVVCVEAGLGLDQAIQNVSKELAISHPEICEELGLITLEMRAGKRRSEALRNLADRTGEPELRKLVAILIQTDRFGTSIADSLRTHADFMRIRRRQEAEERAGKVGVKLVFPIFFCILPAMLIVVAGPGLLQIMKGLFPMMRQFRQNYGR
jgi:tight adherence protein C